MVELLKILATPSNFFRFLHLTLPAPKIKIISLALHDYTRYLASHLVNCQQNSLENSRANKKRKFDSLVRPLLNPFL